VATELVVSEPTQVHVHEQTLHAQNSSISSIDLLDEAKFFFSLSIFDTPFLFMSFIMIYAY